MNSKEKKKEFYKNEFKFKDTTPVNSVAKSEPKGNPNAPQFNIPIRRVDIIAYFEKDDCPRTSEANGNLKVYSTAIPNRSRRKILMGKGKMPNTGNRKITKARKLTHIIVNKITKVIKTAKRVIKLIQQIGMIRMQ